MLKARIIAVVLVIALAFGALSVTAQDQTIVDIAVADGNFTTLVSLVEAAGLAETLSGEGPFTVFAPTDEAFAALPDYVVEFLTSEAGADTLSQILLYHVVDGAVLSSDLSSGPVPSMDMGNELDVTVDDMGVVVNNATVTTADIEASNGVIHVVDTVLVPDLSLAPGDQPTVLPPGEVTGDIITAGSSTVGPLSQVIQENFVTEGYAGSISNSIIGSGAGFERFCEAGETDISNASRPIRESEVEACQQLDPPRNPIEFRVGTDALAVVVNPSNDFVDSVTLEELALIFSTAETWQDVNPDWPAEPILRFIPGTDSGTFDYFVEAVFEEDPEPIQAASNTQLSEDDNVLLEGVANNEFAIGFFGYAYFDQNQEALKILSIEGVEANAANVDAGEYPLARPLFIYSDRGIIEAKPQVGQFIAYYLQNVNDVIGQVGYFPANPYALRVAKLQALALTWTSMGM